MNIQEFRKRIDEVDDQLVRLLSVRAQLAIEIGRTKTEAGVELYDPAREDEIARRVLEANPGVLDTEAITRLFREIVSESRRAAAQAANLRAPRIAAREIAPSDAAGTGSGENQ